MKGLTKIMYDKQNLTPTPAEQIPDKGHAHIHYGGVQHHVCESSTRSIITL